MRTILLLLCATGCAFDPRGAAPVADDVPPDPDAAPDAVPVEDIHHLEAAEERLGDADLTIATAVTLDTGTLAVTAGPADGITLAAIAQDGGGPELAVLRVRDLVIESGAVLRATGTRPLVILARSVRIEGTITVAARNRAAGAGGASPGEGTGRGGDGTRTNTFRDSGGGGGAFGDVGGAGGNIISETDAAGGMPYGDAMLTTLAGGSGGGSASGGGCTQDLPGAGGGALQIYAAVQIVIPAGGALDAGGGGGGRGRSCWDQYTAGRGGGSGGAIYLQTPAIDLAGTLAANGGGGGGGGAGSDATGGADGTISALPAAGGESGGSDYGSPGGPGGAGATPASAGGNNADGWGNGGGGGGSVGRIVLRTRDRRGAGLTSPPAVEASY